LLVKYFDDKFYRMTVTVHPQGIEGEIRGKSSNVAYAAKQMVHTLITITYSRYELQSVESYKGNKERQSFT